MATAKKKPVEKTKFRNPKVLKVSKKQTGDSVDKYDKLIKALPPGKRRSKSGKIYYETRKNRSDKPGALSGILSDYRKEVQQNYKVQAVKMLSDAQNELSILDIKLSLARGKKEKDLLKKQMNKIKKDIRIVKDLLK